MSKILFIDDRISEIIRQWNCSGCESNHELLPLVPFQSLELAQEMVELYKPDIIIIGYGLSNPSANGSDVINALRNHGYRGLVFANSGGGISQFIKDGVAIDESVDRSPMKLKSVLETR